MDEQATRDPPDAARNPWAESIARELQHASGQLSLRDLDYARSILKACAERLPEPRNAVERCLLRGLLFEFASRSADLLCRRTITASRVQPICSPSGSVVLLSFPDRTRNPVEDFRQWIASFLDEFERTHPSTAATRAARLIRAQYDTRLDVPALAISGGQRPVPAPTGFST